MPALLRHIALITVVIVAGVVRPDLRAQTPAALVVVGARVADGGGGALQLLNVHVRDGVITAVDSLGAAPGEAIVDGNGLVLAPGFIDIHNHSTDGLARDPEAASQISQGITTVVVGQDGSSPASIATYLQARRDAPATVNVATMIGHATVRRQVMGQDYRRVARPDEIERMAGLVEQAMREGAFGLSSGLEYEVGSYAATDEVVAMAAAAARHRRLLHLALA